MGGYPGEYPRGGLPGGEGGVTGGNCRGGFPGGMPTQMPGGFICVLFAKRFVGIIGKVCISSLWKCISYKNPMVHYFTVAS